MSEYLAAAGAEKVLAEKIETLRLEHGWSYGDLSELMERAGCPIERSSIQKIIKGNPPRKITVNELVAFASVFKISVERLLQPDLSPADRIREEHEIVLERVKDLMEYLGNLYGLAANARESLGSNPELWGALEDVENPRPSNPSDYPTWLAGRITRMQPTGDPRSYDGLGDNELGTPFPAETPEDARALMAIPRAVINQSVGVWGGNGDQGAWEPVSEVNGKESANG
ncbi:hypothetical protein [Paenarthrobacter sp. Y-19]|uniref:helix-turn-helix domain-containing protein n=1 Tax=Paenarthrobacter sp. Y-19 TaxID=3031125 RepID=UPI0023DA5D50|nr:hypothetical protein [Paenarthrobacter sp. Y-19]